MGWGLDLGAGGWALSPGPRLPSPLQGVTLTDLKEAEKAAGKASEPEKSCLQSLVRGGSDQAVGDRRPLIF